MGWPQVESHESGSEQECCPFEDTAAIIRDDSGYGIKIKEKAPDLLRQALSHVPVGIFDASDCLGFLFWYWGSPIARSGRMGFAHCVKST